MTVRKTFVEQAFIDFYNRAYQAFQRGMAWYDSSRTYIHDTNKRIVKWITQYRRRLIIVVWIMVFVGVTALFFIDLSRGEINDPIKVGIGGLIGGPILGLIISTVSAILIYPLLWLIDKILVGLIYVFLFTPILVGALFYSFYLILLVVSQLFLLVLLLILFIINSVWLLWQRIFYTCPNIECSYRHKGIYKNIPIHICPKCGQPHKKLMPSLYGLLNYTCTCGYKLPTLNIWGRNKLSRLCAVCQTELPDKLLPEQLIALVGGSSVGKTTFLLMSTICLINGDSENPIRAKIRVPRQKAELTQSIADLGIGIPPAKTDASLIQAYQFQLEYVRKLQKNKSATIEDSSQEFRRFWGGLKFWDSLNQQTSLYYYDAPGEDFSSIERYGRHENVKHLDGLILLVDPFSLDGLRHKIPENNGGLSPSTTPLEDVVAAVISALHRTRTNHNKSSTRLAVVITKADSQPIQIALGDITRKSPTSTRCEQVLIAWGAGNSLQALRQNFNTIQYFACSALGRSPQLNDHRPFQSYHVLEPLLWILER